MYAVIELAGKQYRVAKGDTILVEAAEGAEPTARVLLVVDGGKVVTDRAKLDKARVDFQVGPAKKVRLPRAMKFQPKQGRTSKKMIGHRRSLSPVKIGGIKL